MRSAVMFGTYGNGMHPETDRDFAGIPEDSEIWICNTWDGCDLPRNPDRVYQIHERYERLCSAHEAYTHVLPLYKSSPETEIICWHEGCKCFPGATPFNRKRALEAVPVEALQSTFSYMIIDAVLDGCELIYLRRCKLAEWEEYGDQAKAILWLADWAQREHGVLMDIPYRWEWEQRLASWDRTLPSLPGRREYGALLKEVTLLGLAAIELEDMTEEEVRHVNGEIWSCNDYWKFYNYKIDRLFQVHKHYTGAHDVDKGRDAPDWVDRTNALDCPVMVSPGAHSDIDMRIELDFDALAETYGAGSLSSSIAIMIAQALEEGYERINFEGCTLATQGEYIKQQPGVLAMIDHARARGCAVNCKYERFWRSCQVIKMDAFVNAKSIQLIYGQSEITHKKISIYGQGGGDLPLSVTDLETN